jgi:hypothetical protein
MAVGGGLVEYPRRVRMRLAVRAAIGIRDRARRWKRFIQKTRDEGKKSEEKERKGKGARRGGGGATTCSRCEEGRLSHVSNANKAKQSNAAIAEFR